MADLKKQTVLIVLTGSLGDIARGLMLVERLKRADWVGRVLWLVDSRWENIVRLHPQIDHILVFNRSRWFQSLRMLRQQMLAEKIDLTLDLQRHFKSGVLSRLSGAKRRVGFHKRDSKEGNWLFNTEYIPELGETIPKLEHYRAFLKHLTIPDDGTVSFGFENLSMSELAGPLMPELEGAYVALVLGSSWVSKNWPAPGYKGLLKLLLQQTTEKVVLIGDSSQTALGRELQTDSRVLNFVGRTSLVQLLGVLKGAALAVGPDSGPGHLASTLNVPYVSLFGPTDAQRTAPYLSSDLVLQSAIGCSPCYRRQCPGLENLCMRLISPEAVFTKIQQVLGIKSKTAN